VVHGACDARHGGDVVVGENERPQVLHLLEHRHVNRLQVVVPKVKDAHVGQGHVGELGQAAVSQAQVHEVKVLRQLLGQHA
jgi:hypothetical protein